MKKPLNKFINLNKPQLLLEYIVADLETKKQSQYLNKGS